MAWATSLKASDGFNRLGLNILTGVAALISFWLLGVAMKSLPLGSAYAIWVGTAILGIVMFGDPATLMRLAALGLIAVGIIMLMFA